MEDGIDKSDALCHTNREVVELPVGKDNTRLVITVSKEKAKQIEGLADQEKRSVSAMTAVLIEEALYGRDRDRHAYVRGAEYYARRSGNNA